MHGSFNDFGETAELQVILAPGHGRGRVRARRRRGRRALGVAPLMQAVRVHEGGELRYETVAGPGARARARSSSSCGRPRSTAATCSSARRLPIPAAARAGLRRRRRAPGHGRGGRDLPRARLGPTRGGVRAGLPDPRRPAQRDLRGARGRARGERLSEAGAALVGGGGGASARRPDRLPGAVLARRAA